MAVLGDRPLVGDFSPWEIWVFGVFGTVLGSALFAVATYQTRALSRRAAALLATGSIVLVAVLLVGVTGILPATVGEGGVITSVLILAGLLAFSTGWMALGWTALRLERPAVAAA
jgi:hypothetical protein